MTSFETAESSLSKGAQPFVILESTQRALGACKVGVALLLGDEATIAFSSPKGGWTARAKLRRGHRLPCGELFEVLAVGELGAYHPGGRGIVFDRRPVLLPGLAVEAEAMPVLCGGQTTFDVFELELVSIAEGVARITVRQTDVEPAAVTTVTVKQGDRLPVGGRNLPVLSVVAPDEARGVSGWVELTSPGR
jgi:hypothetical protein